MVWEEDPPPGMSLFLSRESSTESEVGGGGVTTSTTPHLSDFSVNYNNNNTSFSQDEGSFDGDRPHSVSWDLTEKMGKAYKRIYLMLMLSLFVIVVIVVIVGHCILGVIIFILCNCWHCLLLLLLLTLFTEVGFLGR